MVFKKKNTNNHKSNNVSDGGIDKKNTPNDNSKKKEITKDSVKKELENLHTKIDLNTIKNIDSEKDLGNKKNTSTLKKIYPYWVYIVKDGVPIKNFGVREETFNGIKLLVRTEKKGDETKVVFRELFPEPKYDLSIIDANKTTISKELNLLKQIEKELVTELFEKGETNEYNYDVADVRIAILEKEIQLNSIKYGKSFRYIHYWVRDDGIPALIYEYENNGLRLKKEVKEESLFTEASEVKQIESLESQRDIDSHLEKKDDRDWKKIAMFFFAGFLFLVGTYGVLGLLDYNHEREYGEMKQELEKTMNTYNKGVQQIVNQCGVNENSVLIKTMGELLETNNKLMESCIENNLIETQKPTLG